MSQEDALVKAGDYSFAASLLTGRQLSRRDVLKALGAGSLTLAGGGLLEACGSALGTTGGSSTAGTIKIGFVSPTTGPILKLQPTPMRGATLIPSLICIRRSHAPSHIGAHAIRAWAPLDNKAWCNSSAPS